MNSSNFRLLSQAFKADQIWNSATR